MSEYEPRERAVGHGGPSRSPAETPAPRTAAEQAKERAVSSARTLEQKYGYLPCLHAGNWRATVLDVLRGIKPDFPAGATPTEEMYRVPPPKDTGA